MQNGLVLDRGYTGHEHLWAVDIIHMNGRLYDPALKRFLSPDNFIQDPFNTQNFNRYGYVLNNPLLYTDPSGEIFFIAALTFGKLLIGAAIGAGIAIASTMIANAIAGNPLHYGIGKAAVIGALSGAVSAGIGAWADGLESGLKFLYQAGAHGVSGGVFSAIDGESFLSGFASGFASSLVSSAVMALGPRTELKLNSNYNFTTGTASSSWENVTKGLIKSKALHKALVITSGGLSGGISASISGGEFWDGARQGLITSGLNHMLTEVVNSKNLESDPCPIGQKCDANGNVIKEDKNNLGLNQKQVEKLDKAGDALGYAALAKTCLGTVCIVGGIASGNPALVYFGGGMILSGSFNGYLASGLKITARGSEGDYKRVIVEGAKLIVPGQAGRLLPIKNLPQNANEGVYSIGAELLDWSIINFKEK